MIEFGILLVGFIATLIAIKGETWNKEHQGIRKITLTGYITGILAILALTFGVLKNHYDKIDNQEKSLMLDNVSQTTTIMQDSIIFLKFKVESYEEILTKISYESERQPQWTLINSLSLRSNETVRMPNRLYSGSLLEFVGICGECELIYGEKQIKIPSFHYSNPLKIPIVGPSGSYFNWSIKNLSTEDCGFKIYVLSTPRSRSTRWSYEEEENK